MPFCVANKMEIRLQPLDVSNTVWELESSRVDRHTLWDRPRNPPRSYKYGTGSFPGIKWQGRGVKLLHDLARRIKKV
jgi:hypothetical protein